MSASNLSTTTPLTRIKINHKLKLHCLASHSWSFYILWIVSNSWSNIPSCPSFCPRQRTSWSTWQCPNVTCDNCDIHKLGQREKFDPQIASWPPGGSCTSRSIHKIKQWKHHIYKVCHRVLFATFTLAYFRAFKIWGLRTTYLAEIDARKKDSNFRLPRTTKTFFASVILFNPVRNEYEVKTQSFPVHFYGVKCGVLCWKVTKNVICKYV